MRCGWTRLPARKAITSPTRQDSVASLRMSGVFNAGDVSAFVSAVTSYLPVEATTTGENVILLQRRSQPLSDRTP